MTDWLARAAAKLADKSKPAEVPGAVKRCEERGEIVGSPVCKDGTTGREPYCVECWLRPRDSK